MKNYRAPGNVITFTAGAAYSSGDPVIIGSVIGIATADVANGAVGEAQLVGVFELAKKSADTPSAGAKAYWDNTNKEVTTTSTANTLLGVFVAAYGSGVLLANVRLDGVAV